MTNQTDKVDPWAGKSCELSAVERDLLEAHVNHAADKHAQGLELLEVANQMRRYAADRVLAHACARIGLAEKRAVSWIVQDGRPTAFVIEPREGQEAPRPSPTPDEPASPAA